MKAAVVKLMPHTLTCSSETLGMEVLKALKFLGVHF